MSGSLSQFYANVRIAVNTFCLVIHTFKLRLLLSKSLALIAFITKHRSSSKCSEKARVKTFYMVKQLTLSSSLYSYKYFHLLRQLPDSLLILSSPSQCNWPRGKVMGGSSVLNYMMYTRGNARDYDSWAEMGNTGWDFKNVSHYFRKLENNLAAVTPGFSGTGGPVTITNTKFKSKAASALVDAGVERGYPQVDYNGPTQIGFSYLQATIKNGTRQSTNVAYLYPIPDRKNLHVKKNSQVTSLLIDADKNIYGVKFVSRGRTFTVNASREVILSAGAIATPQILMLSGNYK